MDVGEKRRDSYTWILTPTSGKMSAFPLLDEMRKSSNRISGRQIEACMSSVGERRPTSHHHHVVHCTVDKTERRGKYRLQGKC
jgi:hypothetical protein